MIGPESTRNRRRCLFRPTLLRPPWAGPTQGNHFHLAGGMSHTWDVTLTEAGQLPAPADAWADAWADAVADGLPPAAGTVPATRALEGPRHGR